MSNLFNLLVLLGLITSNIYMTESFSLTPSILTQLGYSNQSTEFFMHDDNLTAVDLAENLTYLYLSSRSLTKITNSKQFSTLKKVTWFEMYKINITSLTKAMFNGMTSVELFEFTFGNIKTIDVHTFENMSNLWRINLRSNSISSFEYLQIPKQLNALVLNQNNMNYFALSRTMGVLKYLDISYNRFRSFKSMDFTFLANLTYLDLSHNPHAYPNEIPGHLKPLVNLENVNLANLSISAIDSNYFKYNTKLRSIDLSLNKIDSLEIGAFAWFGSEWVSLDYNNLTKIKSGMFCSNFSGVSANLNQISELEPLSFCMGENGYIYLSNNQIAKILPRTFENARTIALSFNQLTELDNLTFAGADRLEYLDLSYNKISEIGLASINEFKLLNLKLSNNLLTKIEKTTFSGQDQLEFIDLSQNNLSTIESEGFAGLSILKEVYLDGNQLTELDSSIFTGCHKLGRIYLRNNTNLSTANIQSLCPPTAIACKVVY